MTETADRPDLRVVEDEEVRSSAALAPPAPAVAPALLQPAPVNQMGFVKIFALEAAMGAGAGALVAYFVAPKQRKIRATGIGALAGMGLQIAMRGVSLSTVLPQERRTPFRILTIGVGAASVIGAGYLAFKKG